MAFLENRPWLYWLAAAAIILVAAQLRLDHSSHRPFHADEGVQAYQAWRLFHEGIYEYSPEDRHGPLLYDLTSAVASDGAFDDAFIRWIPMAFSLGLIALILGSYRLFDPQVKESVLRRPSLTESHGRTAALIAGALLAISPFPVIYGTYFIQEPILVALTVLLAVLAHFGFKRPSAGLAAAIGVVFGAMLATKETATIHAFAIWLSVGLVHRKALPDGFRLGVAATAIGAALIVWAAFFSRGFSDWDALGKSVDAYASYLSRAGGQGHEKAWTYYAGMFWPHLSQGARFGEPLFLTFAALGAIRILIKPSLPVLKIAALLSIALFVIYSAIPYKTPWLALTSYSLACLIVGYAGAGILSVSKRWSVRLLAFAAIGLLLWQQWGLYQTGAIRYAADERNPYLYQHTSAPFKKLLSRVDTLDALEPHSELSIAVASPDHAWPLPWYWRSRSKIGYWEDLPFEGEYDLLLYDSRLDPGALAAFGDRYVFEIHGLRPNTLLSLGVRKELWQEFQQLPPSP